MPAYAPWSSWLKAAPAYIIAKDIIHALLTFSGVIAPGPRFPGCRWCLSENY